MSWLSKTVRRVKLAREVQRDLSEGNMYSLGTTLLKALVEYLKHAGFITAAQVSAIQIPQTASDWSNTNTLVSLALPLLPALWRALENYRKNGRGPGQDAVWQWPWSRS